MNFDEIKKNYIKNCADVEKVKDKIILREQQIARLEKKRNKLIENNYVLVYDASTGKFIPIDKSVINDNDGGVF